MWRIDESVERLEKKHEVEPIGEIFKRILDPKKYRKEIGLRETPADVRFDARQWKMIDRVKLEEEQNKNDLMTDRVIAQTFRDLFMRYNKPWVVETMHEIFTPRTLFIHRKDII